MLELLSQFSSFILKNIYEDSCNNKEYTGSNCKNLFLYVTVNIVLLFEILIPLTIVIIL